MLNFYFKPEFWHRVLLNINKNNKEYGQSDIGRGKKVQVEFVSANPTGPLTLGNGRGGFTGDILSNIFKFLGYKIDKEYYVNDVGGQVKTLGESLQYIVQGKEPLETHYRGDFYNEFTKKYKNKILKFKDNYQLGKWAGGMMLKAEIKPALKRAGIKFNKFFFESTLYQKKFPESILRILKKEGRIYEKDGGLWLK